MLIARSDGVKCKPFVLLKRSGVFRICGARGGKLNLQKCAPPLGRIVFVFGREILFFFLVVSSENGAPKTVAPGAGTVE